VSVSNLWSRRSKLFAADGATGDFFGTSVAIYGTSCMIGARLDDDLGLNSGGMKLMDIIIQFTSIT
jgi:hypothetical protein